MGSARRTDLRQLALAASACTALTASATFAASPPSTVAFDLPSGSLAGALEAFAAQSHQSVIFDAGAVAGRRFAGFHGSAAPDVVLQRLLQGSALTVEQTGPRVFVLKARSIGPDPNLHRIAMAGPTAADQSAAAPSAGPSPAVSNPAPSDTPPVEVVVTGTHIRGVKAIASPTVEVTQDDLRRDGDATIAEGIAKLPQVFNGQATPTSYLLGSDSQGTNASAASGVNLRGLGASATLVLMDGRRLAGTGTLGDFTDVSAIPTAAVDHVEVLLDGASAIYGPDLTEEIMANCGVEIAFAPKELKVAQDLSDRLGTWTYAGRSRSRPALLSRGSWSTTESDQRRPLMLPQEILQMPPDHLIVLKAGMPAARGRKIVYWQEKGFVRRVRPPLAVTPLPITACTSIPAGEGSLVEAPTASATDPLTLSIGLNGPPAALPPLPEGAGEIEVQAWVDAFIDASAISKEAIRA